MERRHANANICPLLFLLSLSLSLSLFLPNQPGRPRPYGGKKSPFYRGAGDERDRRECVPHVNACIRDGFLLPDISNDLQFFGGGHHRHMHRQQPSIILKRELSLVPWQQGGKPRSGPKSRSVRASPFYWAPFGDFFSSSVGFGTGD